MKGLVSQAVQQVYRDYRLRHKGERGILHKFRAQMKIWVGEMELDYLYEKYDGQEMPVQQPQLDRTPQFAEVEPAERAVKQQTLRIKTEPGERLAVNFKKALSRPLVRRNPFKMKKGHEIPINKQERAASNPPLKQMPLKYYASPPLPKKNDSNSRVQGRPKSLESGRHGQLYPARSRFEARCGKIVKDVSVDIGKIRNNK